MSCAINDGGAAFPSPGVVLPGNDGEPYQQGAYEGMSLRDHFAGQAMQGLLSGSWGWRDLGYTPVNGKSIMENNALCAYAQSDAMVAARGAA